MPDLLLTGATGFLGYYLSRELAVADRSFRALVRPGSDVRYLRELGDRCELVEGDLTDPATLPAALAGIDTVIHAAAVVSFRPEDDARLRQTNVDGTANLVNMMLEAGCRRLLYVSSVAALDRRHDGPPVTVADRAPRQSPNSAYARSKHAADREVWRGQAEGLSVAAVYPSVILGAGAWSGHNTPALWPQAAGGMPCYPTGAAGFVDVRDVARALRHLLERDADGERWLLSAENLSWQQAMTLVAASIDRPPPRWPLPRWLTTVLVPVLERWARWRGGAPLLTRASARNAQSRFAYDGTPYVRETGEAYRSVAETIRETGQAYRTARQLPDCPALHLPLR